MVTFSIGIARVCRQLGLVATVLAIIASPLRAAPGQQEFSSPEAARQALVSAVTAQDHAALRAMFGAVAKDLEPGDPVEQANEFASFARHVQEGTALAAQGETKEVLLIGAEKWPFPVPLVKQGDKWLFDTAAGREEILDRRIGKNELIAINVCRAYVDAQREYYAMSEPDGDQLPKYAQHMISKPDRRNGLYWPTVTGEKPSPLGPLVAKAKEEGYLGKRKPGEKGPRPYHGYYFRILKQQGTSAPGGKFSYVINGNMVAGYALIAYPARWGVSGIMTFIVNQRGRVYQKNLGSNTITVARKIVSYNPDLTWKLAPER